MTSSCGERSRNDAALPASWPVATAGATGAKPRRMAASSSHSAVRMLMRLSGWAARLQEPALPRRKPAEVHAAASRSLDPVVDSEQELPAVSLIVDQSRLAADVGDVRGIGQVIHLEQQHHSPHPASIPLVAHLEVGDLVALDVAERAVVREVGDFADVLRARTGRNAR